MEQFQKFSKMEEQETVLAYLFRMVENGYKLIAGLEIVHFDWHNPASSLPCKVEDGHRYMHWSK